MTPVEILSNGNKWAGEEPDSIDQLLQVLSKNPLDPTFEKYGDFFFRREDGRFEAFGNFASLSHVFRIVGDFRDLYPLALAIKQNKRSAEYLKLRRS